MSQVIIYHNPRCSKSRETLKLLQDSGIEPEIVEYLKNPLTKAQLKSLKTKLGIKPALWLRTKEAEYKALALTLESSDSACFDAMVEHPKLMERPIVTLGNKAAIGRPPEKVLELFS